MSLPEHVHQFHQDIDVPESHWHFVLLEDLGWLGMAIEAELLSQQSISGIAEREYLPGFALSHIPNSCISPATASFCRQTCG